MSALTYKNVTEVIDASRLEDAHVKRFNRMTCDEVFKSFTGLLRSAGQEKEVEKQLILYMRCGELAKIISKKNGFSTFPHKDTLKRHFTLSCEIIATLQKKLDDLYSIQAKNGSSVPELRISPDRNMNQVNSATGPKQPIVTASKITAPMLITPKDLIRLTQKPSGLSAVIMDIRSDQSVCSVSVPSQFEVTVIPVPRETIVPGLILNNLRQNLPVASRSLLQRVTSSDKVVILDDKTPPLLNGKIDPKSHAGILNMALYDYNGREKPKCPLLCFSGGFETWKLEYPTYIQYLDKAPREPFDSLDNLVRNYKKTCVIAVEYPDLSPKPPQIAKPPPPSLVQDAPRFIDEDIDSENVPTTTTSVTADLGNLRSLLSNTSITAPAFVDRGIKPNTPPRVDDPTTISKAYIPPPVPSIDRSIKPVNENKPNLPKLNGGQKPGTLPQQPRMPGITPVPNRATKPTYVLSDNTQRSLQSIYDSMAANIQSNSKRRSSPNIGGLTGLSNMGNTCFMNASLQALFHCPDLHNIFTKENFLAKINDSNPMGTRGVISACFSALMDHIWSGNYDSIRPERFLSLFCTEVNSMFGDRQQHDASEFQMFLLDALHEDTNVVRKRVAFQQDYKGGSNIISEGCDYIKKTSSFSYSPVSGLFKYHMVSETACSICGERSANFEDNTQLSLEIPNSSHYSRASLDSCLTSHFSENSLDGNERWNCPRCKKPQPSTRVTKLWCLPSVLVIHLKRFSFIDGDYQKNQIPVEFDANRLSLKSYLHSQAQANSANYRLFSVTNHRGRLNSGHYTSTTYHSTVNEWFRFDDEGVNKTSASNIDYSDAYILYYMKV